MRERLIRRFTRACCCFILVHTCWLVRMRRRAQCAGVMRDRLLVLAPVVFNPSPEARISSSLSHRHALSLAEHLAMQALINTGMAILSVTEWGGARGGGGDWLMTAWEERRRRIWGEANFFLKKAPKQELSPWWRRKCSICESSLFKLKTRNAGDTPVERSKRKRKGI